MDNCQASSGRIAGGSVGVIAKGGGKGRAQCSLWVPLADIAIHSYISNRREHVSGYQMIVFALGGGNAKRGKTADRYCAVLYWPRMRCMTT
eukprot:6213516-Pleurochrysis_carterae.AAC.3